MTLGQIRQRICRDLREAGIESADYESRILMEYFLGVSREDLILYSSREIPAEDTNILFNKAAARVKRVPLQYLTGQAPFMGYSFLVNEHVLIPRMDTECLVEKAVEIIRETGKIVGQAKRSNAGKEPRGPKVLDLCTGSGCIGISLKLLCPKAWVLLSDLSGEALEVAGSNAGRLGAEVEIIRSDLFREITGTFDMIISNPPYIPSGDIEGLMPEVRDHEPGMALDGHEDGLAFYRRIIREAGRYLNPEGHLLLEIGAWQAKDVSLLLRDAGFCDISICRDLAGLDRIASAVKPPDRI